MSENNNNNNEIIVNALYELFSILNRIAESMEEMVRLQKESQDKQDKLKEQVTGKFMDGMLGSMFGGRNDIR